MMEPYEYHSLPNNKTFRIILLEAGQERDAIRCQIETYDAHSAPDYEALSYVWGDPSRELPMESDGKHLFITRTLDVALRRLRFPQEARMIWIDQICINQDDLDERAQQVQLMKSIYSNAKRVLVWLGDDDGRQAPGAKALIKKLNAVWDDHIESLHFPKNEDLEKRGLPRRDDSSWGALQKMLGNPYFERVWVVQECRVASNLLVLWGNEEISWKELYHAYFWVASNGNAAVPEILSDDEAPGPNLSIQLEILFSAGNSYDPEFMEDSNWIELLKQARSLKSTDCRDKVYSLQGLFGEDGPLMRPNYRKPAPEVFAEVVTEMIPRMKSLRLLSFAQLAKNDEFPLWAPRWEWDSLGDMTYKPFEHYKFDASRGMTPVMGESHQWDILRLKGFLIDAIEVATPPLTGDLLTTSTQQNLVLESWGLLNARKSQVESMYQQSHELILAFIWTLTAGQSLHSNYLMYNPADNSHLLDFAAYMVNLLLSYMEQEADEQVCQRDTIELGSAAHDAYLELEKCDDKTEQIPNEMKDWIIDAMLYAHPQNDKLAESVLNALQRVGIDEPDNVRYQTMMSIVTLWRRFFVSERGYLGLGAHGVQPGDKMCILFGGATPYVVRPTSVAGEYLFLGECYVHGLMNGEAIEHLKRGNYTSQWFHLR